MKVRLPLAADGDLFLPDGDDLDESERFAFSRAKRDHAPAANGLKDGLDLGRIRAHSGQQKMPTCRGLYEKPDP